MQYTDYLGIREGFQASINLEYDLNNIEKLKAYIPTEQSVKALGSLLRPFYFHNESDNRAAILVGPYGRGKSHLLLVLTALTSLDLDDTNLSKEELRQVIYELCEKINQVNSEIGGLARTVVDLNIRTLPVIINSNTTDINQAFLLAINTALINANLQHLLPTTYFDSALSVIEKWSSAFPKAYKTLQNELKMQKTNLDELCIGLKQYNQNQYSLFCSIYPKIAAGTEFNPLVNMDVVKMYSAIAAALKEQTSYSGINIIFDEFSKFLETNIDSSKMLNFKIIQDMAEAATRSGNTQIHFTCVTHKDILEYSSSDSFKTVAGRFKEIKFVSSSEQSYELIANAIEKKPCFTELVQQKQDVFSKAAECFSLTRCFTELEYDTFEAKIVTGCFPLAPMSSYVLLRISELVGQNERTLFSFLSQNDEHTLQSFIKHDRDSLDFITVDYVYDYFEELFKKEIFNRKVHTAWSKASSAIKRVSNENEIKIIKAIAVINMISDENLKASSRLLKLCLMLQDDTFERAIKSLLSGQIVSIREGEYVLLTNDEININAAIHSLSRTKIKKLNTCEILTQNCQLGFVIPREYNDKFSMLRFFKIVFFDAKAFVKLKNSNQLLLDSNCDGLIIYIIDSDNTNRELVLKKITSFQDNSNIIICLSKQPFSENDLLKKSVAISELKAKHTYDEEYLQELIVFEEDIKNRIKETISTMFSPSSPNSEYYNCNGRIDIRNNVNLIKEISKICEDTYPLTPVINNEMVNKRVLNAQNLKGRDLVVSWLLEHANENEIPLMQGYGPEVSIFNSVFKHTGLYKSSKVENKGINSVIATIKNFITGCEKKQSNFYELYRTLSFPPYSVRKGLIPLFIAYVIRQYLSNVVLYFKNKEVELSASILNSLNEDPENYYLLIETGTQEKEEYLDKLENLFLQQPDMNVSSVNKCYSVVKLMQNWVRGLPEYTKKFRCYYEGGEKKQVDDSIVIIRSELLKFEVNARDLLYHVFLNGVGCSDFQQSYNLIRKTKEFLDNHLNNSCKELQLKLKSYFIPGYQGSLSNAVISWYQALPEYTKTKVFDSNANFLLSIAKNITSYDNDDLLDKFIFTFTSIGIADWNDAANDLFLSEICDAIARVNSYTESDSNSQKNTLTIQIASGIYEKSFSTDSISPLGQTTLNNLRSVFEEYNDALEPDEKLAILSQLIEDIIQ